MFLWPVSIIPWSLRARNGAGPEGSERQLSSSALSTRTCARPTGRTGGPMCQTGPGARLVSVPTVLLHSLCVYSCVCVLHDTSTRRYVRTIARRGVPGNSSHMTMPEVVRIAGTKMA